MTAISSSIPTMQPDGIPGAGPAGERRRRRVRAGRPRQAHVHGRQGSGPCTGARLAARDGARRARPHRRSLDGRDPQDLPRRPQARLLLLARIPDRAPAVRRARQPRPHRHGARGAARIRRGPRPAAQARAGRGARQRRPRPPRGVLHGKHGHAGDTGPRLRHPLRPRHLPAGVEGRLAARAARGLAVRRQPVGVRAARGHLHDRLRRQDRQHRERGRRDALRLGARGERQCDGLRHAARRLARAPRQYAAALVGAGDGPAAARGLQPRRSRRRAGRPRAAGGDLAGALPERRNGRRPRVAAAAGVLFRLGVAAGSAPPAQGAARRARRRSPTTCRSS